MGENCHKRWLTGEMSASHMKSWVAEFISCDKFANGSTTNAFTAHGHHRARSCRKRREAPEMIASFRKTDALNSDLKQDYYHQKQACPMLEHSRFHGSWPQLAILRPYSCCIQGDAKCAQTFLNLNDIK